jgi:hypothetical protein
MGLLTLYSKVWKLPLPSGAWGDGPWATWKLYSTAMLISTSAWSFHSEDVFLMSKFIFLATSCTGKERDMQAEAPLDFRRKRGGTGVINGFLN